MAIAALVGLHAFNPILRAEAGDTSDVTAFQRARELLRRKLSEAQRKCFDRYNHFYVVAASGRRYRVADHSLGYIDDNGKYVGLCVYPKESMPEFDKMLAWKLYIESDEEGLLRTANKIPGAVAP